MNAFLVHVAEDDLERAAALYDRIDKAIGRLRTYPALGRVGRIPGTRELVIARTPLVAIYVVEQRAVRIVALHHTAREWPTEL